MRRAELDIYFIVDCLGVFVAVSNVCYDSLCSIWLRFKY